MGKSWSHANCCRHRALAASGSPGGFTCKTTFLKTQCPFLESVMQFIYCWMFLYFHVVNIFSKAKFYLKNQILSTDYLAMCSLASYAISPILSVSERQGSRGEGRSGDQNWSRLDRCRLSVTFNKAVMCPLTLRKQIELLLNWVPVAMEPGLWMLYTATVPFIYRYYKALSNYPFNKSLPPLEGS